MMNNNNTSRRNPLLLALIAIIALPLLGGWLKWGGFPPGFDVLATTKTERPEFNYWVFSFLSAVFILIILFLVKPKYFGFSLPSKACLSLAAEQKTRAHYPFWTHLGLVAIGLCWLVMWGQFEIFGAFRYYTFVPLWWGCILFLDGLLYQRNQKRSFISTRPVTLIAIALLSIFGWYYFEFLNFFVMQNWYYPDLYLVAAPETYLWSALTFSTIWPSLFLWYNLLLTIPGLAEKYRKGPIIKFHKKGMMVVLISGLALCLLTSIWYDYIFWMIWLGPLMVVGSTLGLLDIWTPCSTIAQGDWRPTILIGIGTFFNSLFWETWNYWSPPFNPNYWKYNLPFIQELLVFEMPLLGYSGYLFFGVECWVFYILMARLIGIDDKIDLVNQNKRLMVG